jgi:hypothetical protein
VWAGSLNPVPGVGDGLEPLLRDDDATDCARSVGSGLDAPERIVDLGDNVPGILTERLVDLVVDEVGCVIGDVLITCGGVDLTFALVARCEFRGGAQGALA